MTKSTVALLAILACNWLLLWQAHSKEYVSLVDENELNRAYNQSQYINPDSTTWIKDPPLYTLSGIRYVKGDSPAGINFELQPLTKYVFGFSTAVFGNPLPAQLVLYSILIVLTFILAGKILGNKALAVIPSLLVSLDSLIRSHAHSAYLDLMQAVLIMFFLLLAPIKKPAITGILIGLIALSKSFMIGGLVFAVWVFFLGFNRQNTRAFITAGALSLLTYIAGYSMFFLSSQTLLNFIDLHWRIIKLYRGYVPEYPKGEVFRIVVMGLWRKWYGDFGLSHVPEWWIAWPLGLFGTILNVIKARWRSQNKYGKLSLLFVLVYGISICLKLVFPRYLIPILPLLYIFSTQLFANTTNKKSL